MIAVTLNGTVFAWVVDGTGAGNLLWSRQGTPTGGQGNAGNALWYDDCLSGGHPVKNLQVLQFTGILSTPVIDASGLPTVPPVMFLTSYCANSGGPEWRLHEIDLTTGKDATQQREIGGTHGDFPSIKENWQHQRAALLQVNNSGNTSTPNLIYILFGTGVQENFYSQDYKGWVVAYKSTSTGLQPVFAYSNEPTGCGTGGGLNVSGSPLSNGVCTGNRGSPACDCLYYFACPVSGDTCDYSSGYCTTNTTTKCSQPYQGAPNWGGHGGGCWMSGNGPAATPVNAINSDNDVHVFFGCGNGGFQEFNGSTPSASNNNGQTVMDFRLTQTGHDSTYPFQTFTPNSPASGVGPAPPSVCRCDSSGNNCQPCTLTLQTMNANDYDMSVGGVTLFKDLAGTQRLVTVDKAGYGYLLTPGSLCGAGTSPCVCFASGDPGSVMTFGAAANLCSTYPNNCDRVASMAVFDNQGSGSGRSVRLNYWPNNEVLTSLTLSDNSTWYDGENSQQFTWSSGTSTTLSLTGSCTADVDCLGEQFVAGDTLTLTGCSCGSGGCPVVTTVGRTSLTINMAVANAFGSCTAPQSFQYKGYFVKPAHDSTPLPDKRGYPGAAVTVSANYTSPPCTNALIWAVLPGDNSQPDYLTRDLGKLYAYTALPNAYDLLHMDWNSTDTWCASSFARPTIVNAGAFVPTYAVSTTSRSFPGGTCPTTTTSGIPYPSGILVYH